MTGNKIQPLWSVIIKALLSSQHIVLELIIYRNISFSCIFIGIHTCNTLHSAHNLGIYSLPGILICKLQKCLCCSNLCMGRKTDIDPLTSKNVIYVILIKITIFFCKMFNLPYINMKINDYVDFNRN